jgi:hypothetical protein
MSRELGSAVGADGQAFQAHSALTGITGIARFGLDGARGAHSGADGTLCAVGTYFPAQDGSFAQQPQQPTQRAQVATPEAVREPIQQDYA